MRKLCGRFTMPNVQMCLRVQGKIFGGTFPLNAAGADGLPPDSLIPGVAVFSRWAVKAGPGRSTWPRAHAAASGPRICIWAFSLADERQAHAGLRLLRGSHRDRGRALQLPSRLTEGKGVNFLIVIQTFRGAGCMDERRGTGRGGGRCRPGVPHPGDRRERPFPVSPTRALHAAQLVNRSNARLDHRCLGATLLAKRRQSCM